MMPLQLVYLCLYALLVRCYFRQLMMFAALGEQSPMILMSLGLSPEIIKSELAKIDSIEKLKVSLFVANILSYLSLESYY